MATNNFNIYKGIASKLTFTEDEVNEDLINLSDKKSSQSLRSLRPRLGRNSVQNNYQNVKVDLRRRNTFTEQAERYSDLEKRFIIVERQRKEMRRKTRLIVSDIKAANEDIIFLDKELHFLFDLRKKKVQETQKLLSDIKSEKATKRPIEQIQTIKTNDKINLTKRKLEPNPVNNAKLPKTFAEPKKEEIEMKTEKLLTFESISCEINVLKGKLDKIEGNNVFDLKCDRLEEKIGLDESQLEKKWVNRALAFSEYQKNLLIRENNCLVKANNELINKLENREKQLDYLKNQNETLGRKSSKNCIIRMKELMENEKKKILSYTENNG